ncbi:baseplate J/gp47 family protein [Burkholderia arboris]|uniref:Baseplate J/gp47 family protein n=1 Tax=Burkholderia metallica TaxID=488729 RepID=A0ABT8PJ68_9BURK|nr:MULTISPECIES: baseplate J/gp47 family protein [Burkholderia cepacia complex]MCA8032016.1 baseplate J/gp47 family protein [Burkholderia arboris]MDN7935186.1 baseplate J/gp47 family protein [Burkholderia metallica]
MSVLNAIELDKLPPPIFIESLDFEAMFAKMLAKLRQDYPEFNSISEADPAYKVLQVCAYWRVDDRNRVNEAGKALLLAFAEDADLDHIGITYYREPRLLIDAGDENATPPIPPTYEDDDSYRNRLVLEPEGASTAGPIGAYVFHGRSADGRVKDIGVDSPEPGEIMIYVLSREGDGTASEDLITVVSRHLNGETVRPLCEGVTVRSALIKPYRVRARLYTYEGPDQSLVLDEAKKKLAEFQVKHHRIEHDITMSALYAALHQPGVQRVEFDEPNADIACGIGEAAYCTDVDVVIAGTAT